MYGTSNPFCLDILKLWENTDQENRFNCFFGDYDNRQNNEWWENSKGITFKKEFTTPRDILRKGVLEAREDKNLRYLVEVGRKINKKIRMEFAKLKNERLWNNKTMFKGDMSCSLLEFLAGFALGYEKNYRGNTKEQIMNKILQFHSIRTDENGNLLISQFREEPNSIKSGEVLELATFLALHISLEYYSDYYRDILKSDKEDKESKFHRFDKKIRIFYENLGNKILSMFLENKIKNDDTTLDMGYIDFFEDTRRMIKEKVKQDSKKNGSEQLWNTEFLISPSIKIGLAELITSISSNTENITSGKISREMARNRILNYYSIKQEGYLVKIKKEEHEKEKTFNLENDNFNDFRGTNEIMSYLESDVKSGEEVQEYYR